jgi:hypothetical protein
VWLSHCLVSSSGKWIPDESCDLNRKATAELRKMVANPQVWHIIHSCDKADLSPYSLQPPRPLRWSSNSSSQSTNTLWHSIVDRMKDKKLVLVGDSVMFQTLVGLVLYLESIGITCTPLGTSGYKCGSGMEIHRPFYSAKLNDEFMSLILPGILGADVAVVNAGLHYGLMTCQGPSNSGLCDDVRAFFALISGKVKSQETKVRLAWMDSYRPHFPSANGAYLSWKNNQSQAPSRFALCGPISEPMSYDFVLYEASHVVAKEFPHIPVIQTYDMTYDRHDMHLGILTHHTPEKLDCVHLCFQVCYWEAIAARIGQAVETILNN